MTLYHGTVDSYLPEIRKEGLRRKPEHGWDATLLPSNLNPKNFDPKDAQAFLTIDRKRAVSYAKNRALYLRAGEGDTIYGGNTLDLPPMTKHSSKVISDASPVLLEIELPYGWKLESDLMDNFSVFSTSPISPEKIKKVSKLRLGEKWLEKSLHPSKKDLDYLDFISGLSLYLGG
jgi:hypothetical protein